jgi:hypothetical protein
MGRLGAVFGKPSDDGGEARADEPDEESQLQEVSQAQAALRGASPLRSSQKRMPQEASQLEVQELSQAQAAHRGASPKRLSRQRMSQQRTQRLDVDSGAVSGPEGDSGRNEMKLESSTKNVCTARRRGSAEAARSNEVEDASGEPISAMQRFANRRKRGSLDNRSSHLMDSMDHVTKSKPMHRSSAWRKRRGSSDCASDMVVSGNAPAPASEATVRTPRFAAGGRTGRAQGDGKQYAGGRGGQGGRAGGYSALRMQEDGAAEVDLEQGGFVGGLRTVDHLAESSTRVPASAPAARPSAAAASPVVADGDFLEI